MVAGVGFEPTFIIEISIFSALMVTEMVTHVAIK